MSIFASHGFTGVLSKKSDKAGEPTICLLSIKVSIEGELQNFLDTMEKALNMSNIISLFKCPVMWDKTTINENLNHSVEVEFDQVTFNARLVSISASKKFKKDIETYDYVLNFEKDIASDNIDKVLSSEYLGRREENAEGKMVLVKYQIKMKPVTEVKEDDLN